MKFSFWERYPPWFRTFWEEGKGAGEEFCKIGKEASKEAGKGENYKPTSPQPPMEYRYDTAPSKPHFDKTTGKYEPEHWHYREYNWNPKLQRWISGKWKYGGPGKPPGSI